MSSTQTMTVKRAARVVVSVVIATGKRPDPFRTRKLSLTAPMVLHPPGCGRVGHHRAQAYWFSPRGDSVTEHPRGLNLFLWGARLTSIVEKRYGCPSGAHAWSTQSAQGASERGSRSASPRTCCAWPSARTRRAPRKAAQGEIAGLTKETVSGTAVVALRLPAGSGSDLARTDSPAVRPRSRRAVLIIGGAAALNSPTDPGTPATDESSPEHLALAVVDELEHPGGEQYVTVVAAPRGDSDPGRQEHVGGPEAT